MRCRPAQCQSPNQPRTPPRMDNRGAGLHALVGIGEQVHAIPHHTRHVGGKAQGALRVGDARAEHGRQQRGPQPCSLQALPGAARWCGHKRQGQGLL